MKALDQAIYQRLQTTGGITSLLSGTTAIYHMQAPEDATLPYVVFSWPSELDENATPHRTKNNIIFIRAYASGGNGALTAGSIDDQVDTAIHLVPLTVSGWTNIWLAREQGLETVETLPNGENIFMRGANYRVRLAK
jgi:hypothetical protein